LEIFTVSDEEEKSFVTLTSGFERGQAGNLGAERQDQVRLRPGLQHHQGDLGIRGCPQVRPRLQGLVQEDL